MTGSDDPRVRAAATEWRTESRFYRRSPGWGWLLGLLLVPLLFGWLGLQAKPEVSGPNLGGAPSVSMPSMPTMPSLNFAPLSILRNGNDFTLSGTLPDLSVKSGLLDALKAALGPGVNLIDKIDIKGGASAPDLSGIGALMTAAADIPDFDFRVEGSTMTLTGTAPSQEVKAALGDAAKAGWPGVQVVNNITVTAAASGGSCETLQSDITAALSAAINFETDGSTLTEASRQTLAGVAAAVKACPDARIAVTGYTDNTGGDAINIPLSDRRAKSVGDYLVSQGVPAQSVTTKGEGAANPVASNDTAAGRAENRRVEITVG
jgi:peptidoglycan-binding protein ArfA